MAKNKIERIDQESKSAGRGYIRTGRPDPTGMEWQYFQHD